LKELEERSKKIDVHVLQTEEQWGRNQAMDVYNFLQSKLAQNAWKTSQWAIFDLNRWSACQRLAGIGKSTFLLLQSITKIQ
jgi:hypothetical protein